jgi:hypothetical protein
MVLIVAGVMMLAAQDGAQAQRPPAPPASQPTSLQFSNATASSVTAFLTLGDNSAGRIPDVRLVDVSNGQNVPVTNVDPVRSLQGSFTLQPRQTVSWNSFSGGVATGSVTFRAFPQSCRTPGGPSGVTKGEFAINLGFEAVDVSSVDGINAIMAMDLSDGGATPWPSNPNSGGRVAQNSGTLTGDKPAWGVFPYRCTQCAAIGNAPPTDCNPLGPAQQSYCKDGTEANPRPVVCQLNRTGSGGTVKFIFKGATDPTGGPQLLRVPQVGEVRR